MYSDIESEHNTETDVTKNEGKIKTRYIVCHECMFVLDESTSDKATSRPVTATVQYTSSDSPAALYQPLDTVTTDYTSVYTTPTGRRGPPSVEVEGKMYSIVDPTKRETDTTYDNTK